ncbi:hypothetical protein MAC_05341 [Metarhizium acridum CQMa 102]|uniref:Uncharacterized protein n=1 Tax=Metarhizium acridum (strain CQMa 102) TaxID=655827 RepID=E9E643_METAQ|nr:uncharacterized protein MAC_05341 [Metarhizium acridum CQMa 102]EFY88576.1 hypothetical protein MAC_05341 [Metarhizium acridum CQMa 102]
MTTRVDIQALGLDIDQAHDRVCTTLDDHRSGIFKAVQDSHMATSGRLEGLSRAVVDVNSRTKHGFLETGHGLDVNHDAFVTRLNKVSEDVNLTVCKKIDNANSHTNKLIVDTRDHLQGRLDEVQEEVESSRRRTHEKLNDVHEAIAGIVNTTRDRLLRKIEQATSLFSSMQPLMRELRRNHKGHAKNEVEIEGEMVQAACYAPGICADVDDFRSSRSRFSSITRSRQRHISYEERPRVSTTLSK